MTRFEVFPDSEELAIKLLLAGISDFDGFTPEIGSKLPDNAFEPSGPTEIVTVTRIGGVPNERHRLDHANLQVDTWALRKEDARFVAQTARAILFRAEGGLYTDPHAVLTGVDDALGLSSQFDTLNMRPRYIFAVYFTVHLP